MLTVFSDRAKVFASICNGAHGYLLKSTPPHRLLDAIRTARDGGSPISPEIARQIVSLFQNTGPPRAPEQPLKARSSACLRCLRKATQLPVGRGSMKVSVNTVRN